MLLKVMAGDKIDIFGKSYYAGSSTYNNSNSTSLLLSDLLGGLLSAPDQVGIGGKGITLTDLQTLNSGLIPTGFIRGANGESGTLPKAYINFMLLDDQLRFVSGDFSRVGTSGTVKDHWFTDAQLQDIDVTKNGYLYVYVSNESNADVFFDNLQVIHTRGPVLEETHYYPFGLTMAGISSKALSFGGFENKYKYNGGNELQSGEFSDGSGLEMFDAVNRMYDPQIGRFWQIDELAEASWEESSYHFAHNDPILFNDPLGLDPEKGLTPETAKELSEVVVVAIPKGFWAKQRLYYDVMDQLNRRGATIDQILQPSLQEMMYRFDGITKHRERVAEMTRESDKVFLEGASFFIPMGWLTKLKYVKHAGKLFKWKRGKAAAKATEEITEQVVKHGDEAAKGGENVVYHSVEDGVTQYVGITNNLARREAEHLASKGIKIEPLMQGLSRADARAVEQALIEIHGLGKNGGTLLNKINSIAQSNPTYSSQLERGYELLKSIGY